jgi:AraC-like DNA-binding protein
MSEGIHSVALERHYSVTEVATMWGLSERTIKKLFEDEAGVLTWGHGDTLKKRCYRTLRIPESVLIRVHHRRQRAS